MGDDKIQRADNVGEDAYVYNDLVQDGVEKNKKKTNALLSGLEQVVMGSMEESEGKTPSKALKLLQKDPVQFADLFKSSNKTDQDEAFKAIGAYVASTKGSDTKNLRVMLQELIKGTPQEKKGAEFVKIAEEMFDTFAKGVDTGQVSLDEACCSQQIQAFSLELMNTKHGETSTGIKNALTSLFQGKKIDDDFVGKVVDLSVKASVSKTKEGDDIIKTLTSNQGIKALYNAKGGDPSIDSLSKTVPSSNVGGSYVNAMMSLAAALVALLANVCNAETSASDIGSKISQKQGENAESIAKNNINALQTQLQAQADASKQPWYMYLIAGVLALAGAVATFFTAGAAGAAVALIIGAVMASPAGSSITGGLSKALGGDNAGPGAQAGATAIVAAITTILSLGAGGFTSATEAAETGLEQGVDAAGDAAGAAAKGGGQVAEDATAAAQVGDEAADASGNEAEETVSKISKLTEKIKKGFNQKWDNGAFTKGIVKRGIGTYLQGFLGTGGLTESAEAIATAVKPDILNDSNWALAIAITGAVISFAGGLVSATKLTGAGVEERANYLSQKDLVDSILKYTKPIEVSVRVIEASGALAQGGLNIDQGFQEMHVSDLQRQTALTQSALEMQKSVQQQALNSNSDINKAYTDMVDNVNKAVNEAEGAIGVEEQNTKKAISK
jgi:hypothetical protein